MNALSPDLLNERSQTIEDAKHDSDIKVVVTGAGRAFCAGMDVKLGAASMTWADGHCRPGKRK